jgi:basic amino acid/polyamine antiporter, APA family
MSQSRVSDKNPGSPPSTNNGIPQPVIGLREAIALIVGIVIGAGIFKAPSMVAGMTGSAEWMFAAWILGGLMSLIGALCYAELATAYSHTGGDYHFLSRAYGRSVGFLFGWARFSVITTGSIALLAFVFGDYMTQVWPLGGVGALSSTTLYAAGAIVVLSLVNMRSTISGTFTQTWLTAFEVGGLLLIVAAAVFLAGNDTAAATTPAATEVAVRPSAAAFGLAMVFVLLTYGGWNEAAYISAELKGGRRNIVKALIWSIVIITALYMMVVWAYWRGLGIEGMAKSEAMAADLLGVAFGPVGALLISLMVAVAALTSMNATMIVGARSNYAVGQDWASLSMLSHWDGRRDAPLNALRVQTIAALLLVAIGAWTGAGFRSMVEFTAPVFWIFFLLSGISLFVLRAREPGLERPFKVPLYPLLPLVFCVMCAYMLWSSLSYVYSQSLGGLNAAWIGVSVLALGLVLLAVVRSQHARRQRSVINPFP